MMMDRALHQKPASAGRVAVRRGEAPSGAASDEARSPRHDPEDAGRDLLWQVLARGNMERAWKRVKTNKGAAGVDGLDIGQTKEHLKHAWPSIRHQLTEGTYRPMPVRRVCIPGYALWLARNGEVRRAVSDKALETFKQRIRQLTRRTGGRSIGEVIEKLRSYVPGWKAYFGLAQTPRVWRGLDEWMRRRMRALHLKHWRRGKTIYRELLKLGATPNVAQSVAALSHRWWHNSLSALHHVLTIAYFDRLGMPRLS